LRKLIKFSHIAEHFLQVFTSQADRLFLGVKAYQQLKSNLENSQICPNPTFFQKKLKLMQKAPIIRGRRNYVMDAEERAL